MRVLVVASEMAPFVKTGGLADVMGALPAALASLGDEAAVVLPYYKSVRAQKFSIERVADDAWCAAYPGSGGRVYFIEHAAYFNRDGLYQDNDRDYSDNLERFAWFCRRALSLTKELSWRPDCIHAHDWQAALVPVYLKTLRAADPFYQGISTILTVHNLAYQGIFPASQLQKSGLPERLFSVDGLEFFGKINLLKAGIIFSDAVTTVSETYSKEIRTKEFGCGLDGVLRGRSGHVWGILNGLDYAVWNPETDPYIAHHYSPAAIQGKYRDKEALQKLCGFPPRQAIMLAGFVARLVDQKGIDLVLDTLERMVAMPLQAVFLGSGQKQYLRALRKFAHTHPDAVSVHTGMNERLAHMIYAGSDIYLMPSRFEPCGLSQMISMAYGSIPVVHKTGGLADTVTGENGFIFEEYSGSDFLGCVSSAWESYRDTARWRQRIAAAMGARFSWDAAARKYHRLYEYGTLN